MKMQTKKVSALRRPGLVGEVVQQRDEPRQVFAPAEADDMADDDILQPREAGVFQPEQRAAVLRGQRPVGAAGGAVPAGTAPIGLERADVAYERPDDVAEPDIPWVVIVWNDPVNLMSYVVFVLQKLFGYDREKATRLMLDVHHKGKAVVSSGPREKAEFDVYRLHGHGLWATMQKDR